MLDRSTPIGDASLRGLHPHAIEDARRIEALLERARAERSTLHRGLNAQIDLETATIEEVEDDRIVLRADNFDRLADGQVFLSFNCDERPYFFATSRLSPLDSGRLVVRLPKTIYYSERRDRLRRRPDPAAGDPSQVRVELNGGRCVDAVVTDVSPDGLGLLVHGEPAAQSERPLTVHFDDGRDAGSEEHLTVRNRRLAADRDGWTRIGLARGAGVARPIEIEMRPEILGSVARADASLAGAAPASIDRTDGGDETSAEPEVLTYANLAGEQIVGLLDAWGERRGATAVVLTNGWGQTKEALLPLARTLVATFRAAGQPVCVVRYDGIRKRGESHTDPESRVPGREHLHFTYSQAVDDIETTVRFLRESPDFRARSVVLVSVSASSIEARRAVARDRGRSIDGWVCLVGSPDLQSMTRAISGGIDFAVGWERGMRFGYQELMGVVIDTDRMGHDAEAHSMIFIEDARCDFEKIEVPITWLHGRFDAWVDLDRVRDVLSHGDGEQRRLVVLPTGHQLKTSRQATDTFQLVASEVGRMALGRALHPAAPSAAEVRRLRIEERKRLPERSVDLHGFWRDYLVGRDRSLGIELLTASSAYRAMMSAQIAALDLRPGARIADLGCGTGAFELELASASDRPEGVRVWGVDYVREAMQRAHERLQRGGAGEALPVSFLEADLDLGNSQQRIPLESESFDAVLAALLIGYLERPELMLAEIRRVLRPGGRLVLSSLCRDADISQIYVESVAEFRVGSAGYELPELESADRSAVARNFLNDAAKILELEELGAFHFWDPEELTALVEKAGFSVVETQRVLGSPPQAVIVSATRD